MSIVTVSDIMTDLLTFIMCPYKFQWFSLYRKILKYISQKQLQQKIAFLILKKVVIFQINFYNFLTYSYCFVIFINLWHLGRTATACNMLPN